MKSLTEFRRRRIQDKLIVVRDNYRKAAEYADGVDPHFWPAEHALAVREQERLFGDYRKLNEKLETLGG